MNIGPFIIMRKSELPFYKEVHRLIEKKPDYLDGIRKGIVSVGYHPNCKPKPEPAQAGE